MELIETIANYIKILEEQNAYMEEVIRKNRGEENEEENKA